MLAVCARFDLKSRMEAAVSRRWFKSYQVEFLRTTAGRNNEGVDSEFKAGSSAEVLSMPGLSFEKMNKKNQCFHYAMRMLKAIADNLIDSQLWQHD